MGAGREAWSLSVTSKAELEVELVLTVVVVEEERA